jgi:hypothetical protein
MHVGYQPKRPNPALQQTASRARSFGFEVVLCSALAAADAQVVRRKSDFLTVSLELRSIFPQELPLLVATGGLRLLERYGDFSGSPFTNTSPHQVCVCEAA